MQWRQEVPLLLPSPLPFLRLVQQVVCLKAGRCMVMSAAPKRMFGGQVLPVTDADVPFFGSLFNVSLYIFTWSPRFSDHGSAEKRGIVGGGGGSGVQTQRPAQRSWCCIIIASMLVILASEWGCWRCRNLPWVFRWQR